MITEQNISVVDFFENFTENDVALVHGCNAFHTMGAGIAKVISTKYPEAYHADLKTVKGDPKKLGTISVAKLENGKVIINAYNQFNYGNGKLARYTSYDAIDRSMKKALQYCDINSINNIVIPAKIGCMLGGGNWHIVKAIIEATFENSTTMNIYLCNYESKK